MLPRRSQRWLTILLTITATLLVLAFHPFFFRSGATSQVPSSSSQRVGAAGSTSVYLPLVARASTTSTPPLGPTKRWSDPATWPNNRVPQAGAAVVIPPGTNVLLDVSPPALRSLQVDGGLVFDNQDLNLSADWVMVHGRLQIGTEQVPYRNRATITLTGSNESENIMNMGTKMLGVMGGTLEIHGEPRLSWTTLRTTADKGASQLTLARTPDWRPGDRIVIASTDFHFEHAEEVTIKSVSGSTVTFEPALKYQHWCQAETFASQTITECAEVGLLTRNIVVQGEAASSASGFGGHLMAMQGSSVRIEGAQFTRMGQKKKLGRYPIHFHLVGEAAGSYVKNTSIEHAFNRFLTIHATHQLLVSNNVAYDTIGHGYYFEDGIETRNTLEGNLGLVTRNAKNGELVTPSDNEASVFWITNPDNTIRNNVAAGSEAFGFWLGFPEHPVGLSATDKVWPRRTPLREFRDNIAHSNNRDGLFVDGGEKPDRTTVVTWYEPHQNPADVNSSLVAPDFKNFTSYKNRGNAVWIRSNAGPILSGAKLADSAKGAYFANLPGMPNLNNVGYIQDSLVVGETANKGNPESWENIGLDGRELPHFWSPGNPISGLEFYDGPMSIRRVTLANFQPNSLRKAGALTNLAPNGFPVNPSNTTEAITFVNANRVYLQELTSKSDGDASSVFTDKDGSVTGKPGWQIVPKNSLLLTPGCTFNADWNAHVCQNQYVHLTFHSNGQIAPMTVRRDDGATFTMTGSAGDGTTLFTNLIGNRSYALQPGTAIPSRLQLTFGSGANAAIRVSIPAPDYAFKVTRWGQTLTQASSLSELESGDSKYFYDAGSRMIYIRIAKIGDGIIIERQ